MANRSAVADNHYDVWITVAAGSPCRARTKISTVAMSARLNPSAITMSTGQKTWFRKQ